MAARCGDFGVLSWIFGIYRGTRAGNGRGVWGVGSFLS
ncbi:hypothetical protein VL20_682 [Microcystis panniformis FACHB-1757]|uniref:Uncharacterized protein n=1 Tax=Microcystis panniformis FACHB-1757 TaxID=1638788 RepID=A0A0K1RW11_9CHRO|nr:hypothetical protein VL20_682 [Microcystis panniformis FACHB-1757]